MNSEELLNEIESLFTLDEDLEIVDFDVPKAIRLYEEYGYDTLLDLAEIEPVLISDCFFLLGYELNSMPEMLADAHLLLSGAVDIRIIIFGEESIYTKYALTALADNYYSTGEHETAEEIALDVYAYDDPDAAHLRCYAACIIAKARLSQGTNIKAAHEYLLLAQKELSLMPYDNSLFNTLFIDTHISFSNYYSLMLDYRNQEYHARLAYNMLKGMGMRDANYVLAINNLSLPLIYSGHTYKVKDLLAEALEVIVEKRLQNTREAAYIYNALVYTGNSELFGFDSLELLSKISSYNLTDSSGLLFKLNYAFNLLSLENVSESEIKKAETIIRDCELAVPTGGDAVTEMSIHIYKTKALCCLRKGYLDEARHFINNAFSNAEIYMGLGNQDFVFYTVVSMTHFLADLLEGSELRELLFKLAKGIPERFDNAIAQEDHNTIMRELWKAEVVVNLVVTFSHKGYIECSDADVYTVVAAGKSMLSSLLKAKKETRLLYPEFKGHYEKIDQFARLISQRNTDSLYRESKSDVEELYNEKRLLELELQYNRGVQRLNALSFEDICARLPEGCVLIDYYCHPETVASDKYLGDMRYSVFVLFRNNGKVSVKRLPYINALEVRKWIYLLTVAMRAKNNLWLVPYAKSISDAKLSELLIKPLQEFLNESVKTVIISPDFDICKLPFAALGEGKTSLLDKHKIIYIESARDLHDDINLDIRHKTALVVGNPAFTLNKACVPPTPLAKYSSNALPLTKVEAMLVSEKLDAQPHMLRDASKLILDNSKADVIHIATHGYLLDMEDDDEFVIDPLQRSCLFFSGVNDWLETGVIDPEFGNGILTAEEVYLADMKQPELVALTACFSASGEQNLGGGVIGLRTAFRANGAKVMLLSMWEADDFTSAVLVDRFYDNLHYMPVGEALRNAQMYVRNTTIAELKSKMWFDESRLRRIGYSAESLRELSQSGDNTKPFEHPKYWSGYVIIE